MSGRPEVTITLGRSGQVVKKSASDVTQSNYGSPSGGKRPIRDRLGNMDGPLSNGAHSKNKRQRKENHYWSDDGLASGRAYVSGRLVGREDLRYKLMHKSVSGRSKFVDGERNHVDLRDKLSRNTKTLSRLYVREHISDSRNTDHARRIPPTRSADDLLHMDRLRKSYSSWTLDAPRHRSPDRLLGSSRAISPPRSFNEVRHVQPVRSLDSSRPSSFSMTGVDVSRPALYMSKTTIPVEAAKPTVRAPPTGDVVHKNSYMPEQPFTVPGLLHSLGLEKYAILFQAEEVDVTALKQMGDNDLKELGIPMGPRKKILLAVQARSRRHL